MWKKMLSVITLILVAVVGYNAFSATVELEINGQMQTMTMIEATWESMKTINPWVLVMLVPEQILMYYAAGQIYFSFLQEHRKMKLSQAKLTRMSLEINFVNHAVPSGGVSGLAYLVWRLKEWHVTAGQVSFIHILRYAICALANTIQTWIAIIIVLAANCVVPGKEWWLWLAALIALGIQGIIFVAWLIVRKQKNIDWISDKGVKLINGIVRRVTRGKKRKVFKEEVVVNFFADLRGDYLRLMQNKRTIWKPVIWGALYSFLELATYWVVACALGHPEILPQIMIAEGIASVVGTVMVTPGGMGGYEGAMVAAMVATGVSLSIATLTVVVTRVCVLLGTIVFGYGFYQHSLLSRKDKFDANASVEKE